jgi:hypothetical protein
MEVKNGEKQDPSAIEGPGVLYDKKSVYQLLNDNKSSSSVSDRSDSH